jgi:hypothetical protein
MVDMATDTVTMKGRTDVAHIPYQPVWLFIVRVVQFVLAIIILGLSAYAGSGYLVFVSFFWASQNQSDIYLLTPLFSVCWIRHWHFLLRLDPPLPRLH